MDDDDMPGTRGPARPGRPDSGKAVLSVNAVITAVA